MAGGVATSNRDLRPILGPPRHSFDAYFPGEVALNDARYWRAPDNRAIVVFLARWATDSGAEIVAADMGDHTADELELDLEMWDGAAWTSLFSDPTRRPMLAFDADVHAAATFRGFIPDTVLVPAGTMLRWRVAALPTGGATNPSDILARMVFEEIAS